MRKPLILRAYLLLSAPLLVAGGLLFSSPGCSGQPKPAPGPGVPAGMAADAAVEAQSGTDLSAPLALLGDAASVEAAATQGGTLAPAALRPEGEVSSAGVLLNMRPPRLLRSEELLEALHPPVLIARHFLRAVLGGGPTCSAGGVEVAATGCPTSYADLRLSGGEIACSGSLRFSGCVTSAPFGAGLLTVVLEGGIDFSAARAKPSVSLLGGIYTGSVVESAAVRPTGGFSVVVTGPDGATVGVSYDGDVGFSQTLDFVFDPLFRATSLDQEWGSDGGLAVTGDDGRRLEIEAGASRTLRVAFGRSLETGDAAALRLTLPGGATTFALSVHPVWRRIEFPAAGTRTIALNDAVTVDGATRTRSGTLAITGVEQDPRGNAVRITLDGDLSYTNAQGTAATLTASALVIDHACPLRPAGGTLLVARETHWALLSFAAGCSCTAQVQYDDGSSGDVDLCARRASDP